MLHPLVMLLVENFEKQERNHNGLANFTVMQAKTIWIILNWSYGKVLHLNSQQVKQNLNMLVLPVTIRYVNWSWTSLFLWFKLCFLVYVMVRSSSIDQDTWKLRIFFCIYLLTLRSHILQKDQSSKVSNKFTLERILP